MTSPTRQPVDLSAAPRVMLSTAAEMLYLVSCSVLGPERVPTAQANALEAVLADQERARARAELARVLSG